MPRRNGYASLQIYLQIYTLQVTTGSRMSLLLVQTTRSVTGGLAGMGIYHVFSGQQISPGLDIYQFSPARPHPALSRLIISLQFAMQRPCL